MLFYIAVEESQLNWIKAVLKAVGKLCFYSEALVSSGLSLTGYIHRLRAGKLALFIQMGVWLSDVYCLMLIFAQNCNRKATDTI